MNYLSTLKAFTFEIHFAYKIQKFDICGESSR